MLAAFLDRTLTRRARVRRGESTAFAESQIAKAWVLLIALGVVLTFATFFFGGSQMIYAVWLVLIGVGLFLHGLFSEQLPEWVGVAMILLGVVPLAAGASYFQTRWLAAASFGVGLPLLAAMLDHGARTSLAKRMAQSIAWLAAVLGVAFFGWQVASEPIGDAPTVSLDEYLARRTTVERAIVQVPAGTSLPLGIAVSGDVLASVPGSNLVLKVQQPVELLVEDGKPTGYSRIPGEGWRRGALHISGTQGETREDAGTLFFGMSLSATIARVR